MHHCSSTHPYCCQKQQDTCPIVLSCALSCISAKNLLYMCPVYHSLASDYLQSIKTCCPSDGILSPLIDFSLLMESECRPSPTSSSVCCLVITAMLQTKHHRHHRTHFLSFLQTLHSSTSFILIPSQYHPQILLPKETSDRLHLSVYPA